MTDLQALLRDLDTALNDWRLTIAYKGEAEAQGEAFKRIFAAGGTLKYIAALRQQIRESSPEMAQQGEVK